MSAKFCVNEAAMTAFPLFDLFAATADSVQDGRGKQERQQRLLTVAASMVSSAIQQFAKIRALDEALASPSQAGDTSEMDAAVAIRLMYEEAAKDAERVLHRIDELERKNHCVVPYSDELRDWYGKTMAMLSVSLEEIARGIEQSNRGEIVTASDLRNELHSRLHH